MKQLFFLHNSLLSSTPPAIAPVLSSICHYFSLINPDFSCVLTADFLPIKIIKMITKKELKDEVDTAVAQIIDAVTKMFAKVDQRFDGVEDRLDGVENRLTKVEVELKDMKRSVNDLKADVPTPQEFINHEKRIKKLESAVFPQ